jgi:hypothetical protein
MVISSINLMLRLKRTRVRAAVVPIDAIDRVLGNMGFRCQSPTRVGPAWHAVVYRRL